MNMSTTNKIQKLDNLADLWEGVQERAIAARSPATLRAYRFDWERYLAWTTAGGLAPLPCSGEQLAAYITHLDRSGLKTASIDRALVSISQAHRLAGLDSPTRTPIVREVLKGIKRINGTRPASAAALELGHLRRLVDLFGNETTHIRDRAILLLGWSAALRRSEIVAIDRADLSFVAEGLILTLMRSKTDQEGAGHKIGIPFGRSLCPVIALREWLQLLPDDDTSAVFRRIWKGGRISGARLHATAINTIVKRAIAAGGYDPDLYSAHSLRSGFATSAAAAEVEERYIMTHTRHRSITTARRYIQEGSLFLNNPLDKLLS